jgi:hypothetical protein
MTIWVTVKAAAGSRIEDVAQMTSDLANRLGIAVQFDFNDVSCWAEPEGVSAEEFALRWRRALEAEGATRVVTNRIMPSDSGD